MRLFKGKISVIMPAYNEGKHIYENLRETHRVFERVKCRYEVVLVNDGSSDTTYEEASRASRDFGCILPVDVPRNGGKGSALKEGFNHVTGDFVIFLDSDLELHPAQLHRVFRIMRDRQADVVVGSKYHPESRLKYPFSRKVLSRTYALMLKALFGLPLRDTQTGLKVFRREVLEKAFPMVQCKRYAFDVELLANAHRMGYQIAEAPVIIDFRRGIRWGRIRLKDLYLMGMDTLAIYYRLSRPNGAKGKAGKAKGRRLGTLGR